jgi:hypothetical protein
MMNEVSRSIFLGAAYAMLLAGCQVTDESAVTPNGERSPTRFNAKPIGGAPARDPWRVDAAAVFAAQDAAENAKPVRNADAADKSRVAR